jgi:N-ethylmaleimide reductase
MTECYTQRARHAGLIISEFTTISEGAVTFHTEGCIYNEEQALGWKKVVDSVQAVGGKIYCQIAHGGRAAPPLSNHGKMPVSASPIGLRHPTAAEYNPTGEKQPSVEPHELSDDEVKEIVQEFVAAAKRAVDIAGFDGIEVHGANGYLIDQFLCKNSNKRTSGPYSGETLETRAQFLTEVLEAVVEEVGADRVGLHISPLNSYQDMNRFGIDNAAAEVKHIAGICNGLDLAYLHVMRGDFFGIQSGDVITPARETFKNILIANIGYEAEEAEEGIKAGKFDAVAFGTKFIANPDFPERVKAGATMNEQRPELYYTKAAEGYTDYPIMATI